MKVFLILIFTIVILFASLNFSSVVNAQSNPLQGSCIDTAIGCIEIKNQFGFASFILRWAIGVAGGVAFLLIIYSGFIIMTSQGNPERLKAGQELLSSAVMGLVLLILGAFLLRLIGVDLLNIPGLS